MSDSPEPQHDERKEMTRRILRIELIYGLVAILVGLAWPAYHWAFYDKPYTEVIYLNYSARFFVIMQLFVILELLANKKK